MPKGSRALRCAHALIPAMVLYAGSAHATPPPLDPAAQLATATVGKLTVDEKIAQLVNVAPAIPRLGIPAYNWWTESLHGAFGPVPTTNFPEPIGLAASFDAPMLHDVAGVISTEVRAMHTLGRETGHLGKIGTGLDTWSPNINIFRDPRWGRGQETYGEDPFLTAHMGVAFITGMQGNDPAHPLVIATPKHFAVHSGPESTRHVANVFVSRHDLEDTYLPAFRAAIVEGHAGSIMCAYNRIDGQPACASDELLKDHLRGAWGFKGYVVSDCDAVVDIADHHHYATDPAAGVAAAFHAGVDNECHTGTVTGKTGLDKPYVEALQRGLLTQTDLDRALVRLFAARYRNGDLPGIAGPNTTPVPPSMADTPEHRAMALTAAVKSLVLLKNDGTLPLRKSVKVAVIGPLADATRVLRGNYSSPNSAPPVSLLEGLRRAMPGASIELVPFTASITDGDPVPPGHFLTPAGKPGLRADYFNAVDPSKPRGERSFVPTATVTRTEEKLVNHAQDIKALSDAYKVVWSGFFVAPETGFYRMGVTGVQGSIDIDGKPAVAAEHASTWGEPLKLVDVALKKGQRYPLHFEVEGGNPAEAALFWKHVSRDEQADLRKAVAGADVVVAAVGLTSDLEGEEMPVKVEGFSGGDKTSLDLPSDQRALLESAKALGKPLVVVAMNGSAIDLSWARDHANAILEAWYPGEQGGLAVGQVLAGAADPGGRLPLTFYHTLADLPAFDDYAMKGRTYRYFTGTPVYPFGYGLSYTSFAYDGLNVTPVDGDGAKGVHVTARLRNTGARSGDEVVQVYLRFPQQPGVPNIALRGFRRVSLKAGETREVSFDLSPRDLSSVDPDGIRSVLPGAYTLSLGGGQPGNPAGLAVPTVETSFTISHGAPVPR